MLERIKTIVTLGGVLVSLLACRLSMEEPSQPEAAVLTPTIANSSVELDLYYRSIRYHVKAVGQGSPEVVEIITKLGVERLKLRARDEFIDPPLIVKILSQQGLRDIKVSVHTS